MGTLQPRLGLNFVDQPVEAQLESSPLLPRSSSPIPRSSSPIPEKQNILSLAIDFINGKSYQGITYTLPLWKMPTQLYIDIIKPNIENFITKKNVLTGNSSDNTKRELKRDGIPTFLDQIKQNSTLIEILGENTYFQEQENAGCGRHALNNLFRKEVFIGGKSLGNEDPLDAEGVIKLAKNEQISLQTICKALWNVSLQKDKKIENYCPANENYISDVLEAAILSLGYIFNPVLKDGDDSITFDSLKTFDEQNSQNIIGLLIHLPSHWSCLRKVIIDGRIEFQYIDSLASTKDNFNKIPLPGNKLEKLTKDNNERLYDIKNDKFNISGNFKSTFVIKKFVSIGQFLNEFPILEGNDERYQLFLVTKPPEEIV